MPLDEDARDLGLVHRPGPAGRWDDAKVSCPRVLRGRDGLWRMWCYGRDHAFDHRLNLPSGRIGLAVSRDGVRWERVRGPQTLGAVLDPSDDPAAFDAAHVGVSDVWETDNGFEMLYFGGGLPQPGDGPGALFGLPLGAGRATSADGVTWRRVPGPGGGAILEAEADRAADLVGVGWPQAVREPDGSWKLYFHGGDFNAGMKIGLATSPDGVAWTRRGPVLEKGGPGDFDEMGPGTRQVLRHEGGYVMLYEGFHNVRQASIGLATSPDGLVWTKVRGPEPGGAVFAHAPYDSGRWDAEGVGTPWVVAAPGGGWRLYYVGANRSPPGTVGIDELAITHQIGMAVSDGDLTQWRRWSP